MWTDSEGVIVGLSFLVQLIGVFGVIAARLRSVRHPHQSCDWFVLLCFAVVGFVSALLMYQCSGCWLTVAPTMPLMAVGATLDLKKAHRATAF